MFLGCWDGGIVSAILQNPLTLACFHVKEIDSRDWRRKDELEIERE
jgi:hypothetical protein